MNDIQHTLSVLSDHVGQGDIRLNNNGQAQLEFGDGFGLYITKLDDEALEFSCRLSDLDYADHAMAQLMLEANYMGEETGPGRISVDPTNGEAFYSERWTVSHMDAKAVESAFSDCITRAGYWLTDGAEELLAKAEDLRDRMSARASGGSVASSSEDEVIFRA